VTWKDVQLVPSTPTAPITDEELNAAWHAAQAAGAEAAHKAGVAVRLAVECGRKLMIAQDQRAGAFVAWLESDATPIDASTAYRWIRLAKAPEELWKDAAGLRQAYIACGILPATPPSEPGAENEKPAGNYLVHLARAERALKTQLSVEKIRSLSKDDRTTLKERLTPLVEIWRAL
jgi:hypothetical protein